MHRIRNSVMGTVLAAAVAAFGMQAAAQSPEPVSSDPQRQVEERKAEMKRLGDAMKTIGAFVKNEGGTVEDVREAATTIRGTSGKMVPHLFPAGTGVGVGESEALPAIWERWADFEAVAGRLESTSAELVTTAQEGERTSIARQFAAVGQSCGACHNDFRIKKQ
ncbi:MAG TPA: cytochrome c [Arenibaculum sp.]|nr:cytochrome c [Arenibaculum sp.]